MPEREEAIGEAKPQIEGRAAEFVNILKARLPELADRYGVRTLGVFGSYVRGEEVQDSDLDILVEFKSTPGLFEFVGLEFRLSELLGVHVDLVMRSALRRRIGQRILEEVVQV